MKPTLILLALTLSAFKALSDAQVTGKELIETLKFTPDSISKVSIIREHELLSDEFYNPENREDLTQLAYITPEICEILIVAPSGLGSKTQPYEDRISPNLDKTTEESQVYAKIQDSVQTKLWGSSILIKVSLAKLDFPGYKYSTSLPYVLRCGAVKSCGEWNRRGYALAEKTAHKLTHVSPVWFQAKAFAEDGKVQTCKIEGTHEINREWIETLREKNERISIVPRILFDGWSAEEMKTLLMDVKVARACFEDIANFYSGAVVELYMQALISVQSLEVKEFVIESIHDLSRLFKKRHMELILTVPAPLEWNNKPNNLVTPEDFKKITAVSDFVQIMTYDYRGNKPAGVAPYDWVSSQRYPGFSCIFYLGGGRKTLAGLNFYGYEFSKSGMEAITADRYLTLLKSESTKLDFDEKSMEHRLKAASSVIYFPSLTSLELRISMAHRYNIGIAIWDYGQGFDYFTNLLV